MYTNKYFSRQLSVNIIANEIRIEIKNSMITKY
jgi:hypothetical protein